MKTLCRIGIILLWILLLAAIFYFPNWKIQVLPKSAKSINVFTWGNTLDLWLLDEFAKETGIKVNVSFYDSNEELLVKMAATEGKGYDLILPSDYAVAQLIKKDLLQPIDHAQFTYWDTLYPVLLNHSFDPENRYSIPFEWEISGFGIDIECFKGRPLPDTWRAIFDPDYVDYKIAMKNDPIEVFQLAASYLFGPIQSVDDAQFAAIRQLLLKQRKWIVAYSDFRADYYLATGNAPLALSTTSYIKRIQSTFPNIRFVVPKEGSFVSIESFCIPKSSQKQTYVYALLNYLYRPQSVIHHQKTFLSFTASSTTLDGLKLDQDLKKLYELTPEEFKKYQFFRNLANQQKVRDLWIDVKSF